MTATKEEAKKIINEELKDFPEDKIPSLLDYMKFLKKDKTKNKGRNNIPNEETLQTFKESDEGKNLTQYKDAEDMFRQLGI